MSFDNDAERIRALEKDNANLERVNIMLIDAISDLSSAIEASMEVLAEERTAAMKTLLNEVGTDK
jgi:hypothetical protein